MIKTFELTESQEKKLSEWWHLKEQCTVSTMGGRLSYVFTPVGIGMCVTVKCICGEQLDLTEWKYW